MNWKTLFKTSFKKKEKRKKKRDRGTKIKLWCLEWNTCYMFTYTYNIFVIWTLIMHGIFDFVNYWSSINYQSITSFLQTFRALSIPITAESYFRLKTSYFICLCIKNLLTDIHALWFCISNLIQLNADI